MNGQPERSRDGRLADPFDAGPFVRILELFGLSGNDAVRVARRAVLAALFAWLPLVALAAVQGLALGPDPRESLLLDVSIAARYLLALPLLVAADAVCLPPLGRIARHFVDSGLVPEEGRPQYDALIASTRRLLASPAVELIMVALAYVATLALGTRLYPETVSTWVMPFTNGVGRLSLAGWWRALVSQPLFLILVLTWFWRILLWARYLWGVARLNLRLIPSHPDLAGGLGFTVASLRAFMIVAAAFSTTVAGSVMEATLHRGAALPDFRYAVAGLVVLLLAMFAGPLLLLGKPLLRLQPRGVLQYGALAASLGREFEHRWLRPGSVDPETLGVPDFSATTDLYSIVANVHHMRLVPMDVRSVAALGIVSLLPFVPVVLVALPFERVLELIGKLVT
jgi:hypothetical protein